MLVRLAALLQRGADVKAAAPEGATALHFAVDADNVEIASLLIRSGANVTAANRYGVTPLSLACTNGNASDDRAAVEGGRGSEYESG